MKRAILLLFLSTFFISCQQSIDSQPKAPSKELQQNIDEYFSALQGLGEFNGVIYVVKEGKEIINKAYNLNPDKGSSTFVRTESQFDIHSVSKLMACYLIEKYELEGKVSKSQTINEFFPDFPKGEMITLNMLLKHTSGLPRELEGVAGRALDLSSEQILDYAQEQHFLFEPGTDTQYSNVGYELVYFIIEKIAQKSFSQSLVDEVFKPLKMEHSGAHFYTEENKLKSLAKNHEKEDSVIVQVANILDEDTKTARIFATASDLNRFLDHVREEPYATRLKDESNVIEKNGGSDGIRAQIYTHLDQGYSYVLLCNYEEIPFQQTVKDLSNILEGKPYEVPKEINRVAIELSISQMEKYVGAYTFADMNGLELTFEIEEGQLVVYQGDELAGILQAESENVFFEDPKETESIEFVEDGKGSYDVLLGFKGIKLRGVRK